MKNRTSKLLSISLSALLIIHMIVMGGFTPQVSANTTSSLTVTMTYNNGQTYDGSFMTAHPVTITASSANNIAIEYSTNYGVVWQPYSGAITVSDVGVHHYLFREVGTIRIKTANVHIMPAPAQQAITTSPDSIYVNAAVATSGNGTGWGSAFKDLQEALDAAKNRVSSGDSVHIYVAQGTYYPSKEVDGTGERYKAFQLQDNVAIYGGFDASTGVRDIQENKTILSGDLGTQNNKTDNAYHVFYHPYGTNLDATAVLDGVTIKDGYANGSGNHGNGGGMYNVRGSSPTLTNVTFSGNTATSYSSYASSSPAYGGGMYNDNNSNPTLMNVTFSGNTATSTSSSASAYGGGMYNVRGSSPTLTNVTFSGNTATSTSSSAYGGGMYNGGGSPKFENVTFSGNTATTSSSSAYAYGGGMYNSSNLTLENVTFSGNTATSTSTSSTSTSSAYGGGMYNVISSPKLKNVTFSGNQATNGGGMYNKNSNPTLTNVMFSSNTAASGGGMGNSSSSPTLTNVTFSGNNANSGGGMYNSGASMSRSSPTLTNVTFSGNTASNSGGGIFNYNNSNPTLTNVTMSGNKSSTVRPGTINGETVTIQNSIIIGNNGEPALAIGTTSTIENSLLDVLENNTTVGKLHTTGTSISSETYQSKDIFIDASKQDYRLLVKSIAVDAGNDSKNTTTTDLAGNPRIQGKRIDLGAYEAIIYTVTYAANGATGSVPVDSSTYVTGDNVTVKDIDSSLEKIGHTFAGWNTQADGKDTDYVAGSTYTMGAANVTLYAQWTVNSYTISFDTQGGSAVADQTVQYNEKVNIPAAPTKTGHTFARWYKDSVFTTAWNFTMDVVTADTTLYAKWVANAYTVTFSSDGTTVDTASFLFNEQATAPTAPTKTGHTFEGWYKDAAFTTVWDFATDVVTADTTLYAKWVANAYTVTFSSDGTTVDTASVLFNEQATAPTAPTKTGHTFEGWYKDTAFKTKWDFATDVVTADTTLYAKWVANAYTVTYSSDGTTVDTASVRFNEQAIAPTVPTKTGHAFAGWYKDAAFTTAWDFATDVVTADTMLYAKWELSRYTVSFDAQGGSAVDSQTMLHNEQATAPSTPTKAGYTFTGWYYNGSQWDFDTPVVSDMTLTAGWQAIPSSGGGGDGGGYVPTPTPVQPPSNTEIIEVEIVDPNDPTKVYVKTKVVRKTENRRVTDTVEFTNEHAAEIVKQLAGQGTAMIVLPPQPNTDETFIQLSQEAVSILAENGVQLAVSMGAVQLQLPASSLAQVKEDVMFKVTPLKDGMDAFVEAAQTAPAFANAMTVTIAGQPVRIETNIQGVPVVLTLPVDGDFAEEDLSVYIAHSDGSTEVKQGKLVEFSPGVKGFQFEVDHFSVFGVVHAPQMVEEEPAPPTEEEPVVLAPYIQGYPNGKFKPNANVSRAEMALMLARFMTNDEIPLADATFTDTEKHYAKDAIEVVKASGFFKGKTSTMFDPNGAITRAEMATVVVRWIQETCAEDASKSYCQQVNAEKAFTDVADSHWAAASIRQANVYGVMTGKTNTSFDPNGTLTRAEAVKVLNRLFARPVLAEVTKSSFTDVPATHWALEEIETAATPLIVE